MTTSQDTAPTWRPKLPRWWKNTKRWVLIVGLTFISWVATFRGMLEIIQANYAAELDTLMVVAIGAAVALLMLMILYVLDTLFTRPRWIMFGVLLSVYVLLELISIGFGFGFYWKIIAAKSFVAQNTELATTDIMTAMKVTRSRLENITASIDDAASHSAAMARQEEQSGGTCDANTQPAAGPRQRLRKQDETELQLAKKQIDGRIGALQVVLTELETAVADFRTAFAAGNISQRNEAVSRISLNVREASSRVRDFSADPDTSLLIAQFKERAAKSTFTNRRSGEVFTCPDPTLSRLLLRVVNSLENLPPIDPREIVAAEGPEATKLAFLRLTNYVIQVVTKFDFSVRRLTDTEEDLQKRRQQALKQANGDPSKATQVESAKTLNESDIIPLLVAIFIDACIAVIAFDKQVRHYERYETQVNEAKNAHDRIFFDFIETIGGNDPNAREDGWSVLSTVVMNLFGNFYVAIPKSRDPVIASLKMFFSGLEDQRVLQNVSHVPFLKHFVRREFRRRDSPYQNYRHYDIYRFPRGAWASLLLNTIYDRIEQVRAAEARSHETGESDAVEASTERPRAAGADSGAAAPDPDHGGNGRDAQDRTAPRPEDPEPATGRAGRDRGPARAKTDGPRLLAGRRPGTIEAPSLPRLARNGTDTDRDVKGNT
ncbi:MAG: hypothetical protein ACR2PM_14890 [Hyphomicrobiales bacterium]